MSTTNSWLEELCSSSFMPHGQCYLWDANLLRLHGISDALIALAYFSIPLTLLYFVRKRRDLPYPALFLLFGAFIVACGTTHVMEVITIWKPVYWASGTIKALTAAISLVTAVGLIRIIPQALALPSATDLRTLNAALEEKVRARTADLSQANAELRREVAQRVEAEQEIHRLNSSLQHRLDEMNTLVDLLPVGVAIATDATGRDIRANRAFARMLNLPPDANVSLVPPEGQAVPNFKILRDGRALRTEELPIHRALRESHTTEAFEETIERSDGSRLTVLANAVPLLDETGRPRGCVATYQDITALVEMEERRREMDRKMQDTQKLESLGVLAGGIAHDFNNLLTGILGNASLARMELPSHSSMRPFLQQIEQAAHRAADLCQQMLAYSGKGRFVVQQLDLNDLIRHTTHLLTISISKKCVLHFNLAPTLPAVTADATQLRQIIMNLVINASEAIGERDGVIAISSGVTRVDQTYLETLVHPGDLGPGDYVFLEITDNGSGMDAATLQKIFDPFFTTKFTGRGLGLAAVLGIVRGHQGALKVYSEVGRGSTFKLFLPCAAGTSEAVPDAPPADTAWRGRGHVLIIDDEEPVRTIAARMLATLGFTTEAAADGREGVQKYRASPYRYRLVLLDLTMPHMDGEATFRQLRQINPGVKVLLMSGYSEQEAVGPFTGKGLAGFVQKPFEVERIIHALRQVLREE
jgi:signal transduction histidine kinase/ActR/RegA family two-component response regulator